MDNRIFRRRRRVEMAAAWPRPCDGSGGYGAVAPGRGSGGMAPSSPGRHSGAFVDHLGRGGGAFNNPAIVGTGGLGGNERREERRSGGRRVAGVHD